MAIIEPEPLKCDGKDYLDTQVILHRFRSELNGVKLTNLERFLLTSVPEYYPMSFWFCLTEELFARADGGKYLYIPKFTWRDNETNNH